MGKYADSPGVSYSAIEGRGTLLGGAARVELQVTESLLREFLTLLETAQEELNQRWNGQGNSGGHADRA